MAIEIKNIRTSKGMLQYNISGDNSPKLVLINGGSGPIEGWMRVLPALAAESSVFSYNRLGVSGSDKPQEPQDGVTIVETLREALAAAGWEPPFLLVGHSLGGLYANLYARRYPAEVSGMVLIEASHPKDLLLGDYQTSAVKAINRLLALFDSWSAHKKFSEVHFVQQTVAQLNDHAAFPDIPLYVITGGKENRMMPEAARRKRWENQRELLALSPQSQHVVAKNSGHFPQFTEPQLVIETILACAKQIR
ncbi:alpha/beta hydrolase [Brevibacillus parabrevis]|uniref:alpha/beta fold hydrolase n=1 Tax=Brevibacillus parabrevis TaxID=54914 RepID=UPI002491364B|nr:alpha/beta hydrolase [Brevibacillus parabrevis]MED2257431.1 alpha/beta hydrolase [Brevibacillus parabrevis]